MVSQHRRSQKTAAALMCWPVTRPCPCIRGASDYLIERAGQWTPLQELQDFSGKSIQGMFSGMSRRLKHRFGTINWIIEWRYDDSGHVEYRITPEYAEMIRRDGVRTSSRS